MKHKVPFGVVLAGLIISLVGLLSILNFTNPSEAGSFGVLGLLCFVYMVTLTMLLMIQHTYDRIRRRSHNNTKTSSQRINLILISISFIPVFMMSMNSIGQLNVIDVALMIMIEAVIIFYIVRKTAK